MKTKLKSKTGVSVVIVTKDRRKDLDECVKNYLRSSYKNLEIIVVDNASRPSLITWLPKKYKNIKIITSDVNLGAAQGRNIGLKESKGEYIIFSDDDAYPDKYMVEKLLEVFKKNKSAGIVQPLVYDKQKKNFLQGAGHEINLLTGRIKAWGVKEKDMGQYEGVRQVPLCGCVWMVKREVFNRIGNYDEDYFIPYEDSDFSQRAAKAGYKLFCTSFAKTWHQGKKTTFVHPWIEWLGITSPERAYRVARNKMIFMRKHSPFPENLFFFFIMMPVYITLHSLIIIFSGRPDILMKYWLGIFSGVIYSIFYPFLNIIKKMYKQFDANVHTIKMFLLTWSDPTPMVMIKDAKTVLDLGCGNGKLMQMIRGRINIKYAEGVDMFKPDLEEARRLKTHEKLIYKDIRKIKYPKKSFDVVLASHVLEHMTNPEAMRLLRKMETIAKKQVIIATPIGEMYHPPVDGNPLQLHKTHFYPKDFEDLGYKTLKYGQKWLLGDKGLVHRVNNDLIRKVLFSLNILATPFFYLFQSLCDYVFVAYKNVNE